MDQLVGCPARHITAQHAASGRESTKMYRGHPPKRREPHVGELPPPTKGRRTVNLCQLLLFCALALAGGGIWALLGERQKLQMELGGLRQAAATRTEMQRRETKTWQREVAKALATAPAQTYNASAFFCCFDGPAWMQKRYTAVLGNALSALPIGVKVQVFHRGDGAWARGRSLNPGIDRLQAIHNNRLSFHELPLRIKKKKRSDILLSFDVWNTLVAETVLVFGSGGAFCANALVHFEDFTSFALIDGDGLLLVRRSAALDVIKHKSGSSECRCIEGKHGPTHYLASQLTSGGVLDAPKRVKAHFAAAGATADDALPFAVAGTLAGMDTAARSDLIERCPEAKLIFPSLSEPGCFGAPSSLDKDRCVAALCVSDPRPGGC